MPRIPETEQSEYYFLLLPLAILANLSICTQAEFNQKKKLKSTRKETLRILESWWKKQSGKTTKSPYRNGWSTSGSVARTSRLCRRSPSGDDSMNAASEALGDCPLLEEDRTSFEGWSAIASLVAAAAGLLLLQLKPIPRAETTRQRAQLFIMTSLPFRSVRVAIFIGSSCRRYYIHALLKLCNCKSVEQRNLWSTVHYSGYFNSVQNIY